MLSLRKILLEVSPKQANKDDAMGAKLGNSVQRGGDADAAAKKQQLGVPADAEHAGFGRWTDKQGKTLGFTRDGKWVPAAADADEKAAKRGGRGSRAADQERSQQSRTDASKQDAARSQQGTPKARLMKAAGTAADRISKKMGLPRSNGVGGHSRAQAMLQGDVADKTGKQIIPREPNPDPNAHDKEVAFMPLSDYKTKYAPDASDKEIDALSKFNAKFPDRAPHSGSPVGVHKGQDGTSYILLRIHPSAR